ncbi:extensin-like [Girardinichthys multiradiatus]|uniref:extensin-like n=1 Tax=Girardinichthys multiradiatus TaxID=208333 RepID=UPI001FAB9F01|nr:extensin-like [Girardinichthys multiradiatus]
MAKTTNPKHSQPTRNHPAHEQTPPQYEAEKPDASAELSDARPAAPTPEGQSCRTQDHRPNTTARHTAEDEMQHRTPKAKAAHKAAHEAHTAQMRPHQTRKKRKPPVKVHPYEKKTHSIQILEHARQPYPCQKQPRKKTHPEAHKRPTPASSHTRTMQTPPNPLPQAEKGLASVTGTKTRNRKPSRNHPRPNDAHNHPRPTTNPHPRRKPTPTPTFKQLPENIRHCTPRLTPHYPLAQTLCPTSRMCSLKEGAPAMRWDLPASSGGPYARRYTKCPRARAGRPGMHQPKTPATYPRGPKTPKAQPGPQSGGRYAPGTPSPQAHPGAARPPGQ